MARNISVIVLAAGKGTRMGGSKPKVLRKISGKPLIYWVLKLIEILNIKDIVIVVGDRNKLIKKEVNKLGHNVKFVIQKRLLGTAHAVKVGLKMINKRARNILVLFGDDSALYKPETLENFLKYHEAKKSIATILTLLSKNAPASLGALRRNDSGKLTGVYNKEEVLRFKSKNREILCGCFCFSKDWIAKNIVKIKKSPTSGEYALPQLISVAANSGGFIDTYRLVDEKQWNSINTPMELNLARVKMAKR